MKIKLCKISFYNSQKSIPNYRDVRDLYMKAKNHKEKNQTE